MIQIDDLIKDVQSRFDARNIAVNRVGIRRLRHPFSFENQNVVGYFDMLVNLPENIKGTHMSRFVEILNEQPTVLSIAAIPLWLEKIVSRLQADNGFLQVQFPYFLKKAAPISNTSGWMDYDINLRGIFEKGCAKTYITVVVPVTSLCPCSKEIADYGAHNQRSHVTVTVCVLPGFSLEDLIKCVESTATCELYSILKRADEKAVTERAYDNPKFVEDMVRDIATLLKTLPTIKGYKVSIENFESIHNHSAYAEIDNLSAKTI